MNEQKKLKLGMTRDEVKEILGKPSKVEKDSLGATTFSCKERNREYKIRFFDDVVVEMKIWGEGD